MTHVTCRLTAKNRNQLRNPTLGNRVWAAITAHLCFLKLFFIPLSVQAWAYNSSRPAAAGLLLWARRAGDIDRLLQRRRRATNAGSATLSAYVVSWRRRLVFSGETGATGGAGATGAAGQRNVFAAYLRAAAAEAAAGRQRNTGLLCAINCWVPDRRRRDAGRKSRQTGPILSVFPALTVHSELKSVHPGFPVAFLF